MDNKDIIIDRAILEIIYKWKESKDKLNNDALEELSVEILNELERLIDEKYGNT